MPKTQLRKKGSINFPIWLYANNGLLCTQKKANRSTKEIGILILFDRWKNGNQFVDYLMDESRDRKREKRSEKSKQIVWIILRQLMPPNSHFRSSFHKVQNRIAKGSTSKEKCLKSKFNYEFFLKSSRCWYTVVDSCCCCCQLLFFFILLLSTLVFASRVIQYVWYL